MVGLNYICRTWLKGDTLCYLCTKCTATLSIYYNSLCEKERKYVYNLKLYALLDLFLK